MEKRALMHSVVKQSKQRKQEPLAEKQGSDDERSCWTHTLTPHPPTPHNHRYAGQHQEEEEVIKALWFGLWWFAFAFVEGNKI